MKSMPLELIHAFIVYGRHRNISDAALTMKISQPSLSRHLQQFEERCGEQIFTPEGRNKKLTSLGKSLFLELSTQWIDYDKVISTTLAAFKEVPIDPIKLYGPVDWLSRVAVKCQFKIPVNCVPTLSENVEKEVASRHHISAGVTRIVSENSNLVARLLFESHFKIIIHQKFSPDQQHFGVKLLKELAIVPRLLFRTDTINSDFSVLAEKVHLKNFLIIPNWHVLIELVLAGRGWAVIPSDILNEYKNFSFKSIMVIDIPNNVVPSHKYYLLYKKENKKISWFTEFLDQIQDHDLK